MCNTRLQAPTLAIKCKFSLWWCGQAGGRTYGHVTTKISLKDMDNEIKFSSLQGSARGYEEITYWVVKIAPSGAGTSAVG